LKYATPGFFAFGAFALPAGWLADKWSREGMMSIFFIGIGLASIATSFARTPLEIGIGLFGSGVFAAIYRVGLAIVVQTLNNTGMRIAMNGVWGNASAALITGCFIDHGGWRTAFVVPGITSILVGLAYTGTVWSQISRNNVVTRTKSSTSADTASPSTRTGLLRISAIVFFTTAVSSIIFQSQGI
jgi:MFS family permease